MAQDLISAEMAAHVCGVSISTWYRMVAGKLAPAKVKLNRRTSRWRMEEIQEWIKADCPRCPKKRASA